MGDIWQSLGVAQQKLESDEIPALQNQSRSNAFSAIPADTQGITVIKTLTFSGKLVMTNEYDRLIKLTR